MSLSIGLNYQAVRWVGVELTDELADLLTPQLIFHNSNTVDG